MEFIKTARRRSLLASSAHVLLNILLVAAIWASIWITGSPLVAILLVLISKWRVFAVRPRFWLANVKSNLVDLIVCLSFTVLMWLSGGAEISVATSIVAIMYALWLLVIKPQSKQIFIDIQAIFSVFIGFFALFSVAYDWPVFAVILLAWIIGYASFRHVLSINQNRSLEILSTIWGLILAEITWIFSHWVVGYSFLGMQALVVPQVSIVSAVLSFLLFSIYRAKEDDGKITFQELLLPGLFTIAVCVVLMVFFSASPQI